MSYRLSMIDKRHFPQIRLYFSVFIDFRWKLVILMAVKTLKIIFWKIFLNINQS